MKRILLVLVFSLAVFEVSAQYAVEPVGQQELKVRGSAVIADGQKLSTEHAAALFANVYGIETGENYRQYRKEYRAGVALLASGPVAMFCGGTCAGMGLVFSVSGERSAGIPMMIGGALAGVGGIFMTSKGISMMSRSRKSIRLLANGVVLNF